MTSSTRITIDNEQFFKTGDLGRYNAREELLHLGRIDFQIEINGQRVEAAEIETTILTWSLSEITNCLAVKFSQNDNDSIVAYIVSNSSQLDIESLRHHCRDRLRQYMVPSYFIVLNSFPLNANGKVDRSQLPPPSAYSSVSTQSIENDEGPKSALEEQVHALWCSLFDRAIISRHTNYFALGGSSLSLVQLFNHYQFHLASDKQLDILGFFNNATIAEHAQLLISGKAEATTIWRPLNLIRGTCFT